ncbi:MAG: ATP-binding protein [Acidobacteriota bacterium]|jgi:two-component system sensor histidine kinase HydH
MEPTRRVLVLIPLVMAAALIGTVLASYFSVHAVLATLARGQGDAMLDSIRHGRSTDPAFLEALLGEQREEGLRCIAVLGRDLQPLRIVGECLAADAGSLQRAVRTAGSDEVVPVGRRVRMVRGGPSPGDPEGRTSRGAILIEFEPILTRQLEHGAIRSLGIGGAASLALVVVAVGLWRFSVREERLKERVERDRRLASLGEMAAVLAHEIRNPLTAMKGHAQLLAERLGPESAEKRKADRVVREAVRLEELTADLLSFIRSEQVEREAVDPARILRTAAEEVAPERIELETGGAPEAWSLDPRLMRQALGNLLRNALQASPDGTPAEASATTEEGALVYRVRDRGPGVPEGERARIFEPFYTTRTRGTGLGLAVARRIVELHGGEIDTANHPDGGAVFRVTIPAGSR